MKTKYYKCEFKSDVILNASSNTQGNIELLDFIPGSNFLGMVAKYYHEFENSFEIFHGLNIRFCDANIMINDKQSYKIPLTYHNLKLDTQSYFNRLFLTEDEEEKLRDEQKQLKQVRNGYMNESLEILSAKYNYSQKSAYDKIARKSEDEKMYGYSALQKGSSWIFKIIYNDECLIKSIEDKIIGEQRLGKSKMTEYGQVYISKFDNVKQLEQFSPNDEYTYFYVNSRLVLMDEFANATLMPSIENLGLKSGSICWERTQIKTTTYTPYNFKRQTHDSARNCIQKGSVIVVKGLKDELSKINTFIGAYQSEGFGEIIINPKFLAYKNPTLKHYKTLEDKKINEIKDDLISFLQYKKNTDDIKFQMSQRVQDVYKSFIGPSKSQWGRIRSFATSSKDKVEFLQNVEHYIQNGKESKQWSSKKDKFIKEIDNYDLSNWREFVKLLAMITAKHAKGGKSE